MNKGTMWEESCKNYCYDVWKTSRNSFQKIMNDWLSLSPELINPAK
jgi:hypothetical protein